MKFTYALLFSLFVATQLQAQHFGMVRKNYMSTYYDTLLNMNIDVLDSSTIRLGSINPLTGVVSNIGLAEYTLAINLTGATIDPYNNKYIISSGEQLICFDLASGNISNAAVINGALNTSAFQNYRCNTSDTIIYGLVPQNFYSTYFDSLTMTNVQVLDSSFLRFSSIDPNTGQYTLIGNTPFRDVYTLAGNAIDPHQMLYYYSAVDTLVAIDVYNGNLYSAVGIQLPTNAIFENFTYSCTDTAIYGLTRHNYVSTVYDSILQQFIDVIDSTTFRLSKINPVNGAVTIISPANLAIGATLNGSCFIDPNTMIYYFSTGNEIVGVSLSTGLIVSTVPATFQSGAMFCDMMRSAQNCLGSQKVRLNIPTGISSTTVNEHKLLVTPNPFTHQFSVNSMMPISRLEVIDIQGKIVLSSKESTIDMRAFRAGMYWLRGTDQSGRSYVEKILKAE